MKKLLTKKQIFAFLLSFTITFVLGLLVWHFFANFKYNIPKQISDAINEIDSKFFPASFSSDLGTEDISPIVASDQNEDSDSNPVVETDLVDVEAQNPVVLSEQGKQDLLDDIQEKLDIIGQQVQEIIAEQNHDSQPPEADLEIEKDKVTDDENKQDQDKNQKPETNQDVENGNLVDYPKILISEVQVAGVTDDKQEFVELYNPNNQNIDLTSWYLQRETSGSQDWSTYASSSLFSGKIIFSNSYFLIARTGYYANLADIFTDSAITNDNSFALKNPNGDISDKLGFGNAIDPELLATQNPGVGQSVGRKVLTDKTEEETNNNLNDFEIQISTPKAQNITYTAPISGGGGGGGNGGVTSSYSKVLISEVKISPIDERFIELYNPNNYDVDLTNWYIQRKTQSSNSWGSSVSSPKFEGKTILANGYFLISKLNTIADIQLDLTLTTSNSLILKNPNGEISDKLGFGNAQDFETTSTINPPDSQSIGRKIMDDGTEQDTDNNFDDFELQTPTLKAQNIKWVESLPPTLESIEITTLPTKLVYFVGDALDIAGLTITGNYSDGSKQIEPITKDNISGFDSTKACEETLTISLGGFLMTYTINISLPPPATQLKIVSSQQTIISNSPSNVFTVESQNNLGELTKVLSTTHINLSSSSSTGLFSSASASGPCDDDWAKTSITMRENTAHKSFCYEDSVPGIFKITVSADGLLSDFQDIEITTSPSNL